MNFFFVLVFLPLLHFSSAIINAQGTSIALDKTTALFNPVVLSPDNLRALVLAYPLGSDNGVLYLIELTNFTVAATIQFSCGQSAGPFVTLVGNNLMFASNSELWVACFATNQATFYNISVNASSLAISSSYRHPVTLTFGAGIPNSRGGFYAMGSINGGVSNVLYRISPSSANIVYNVTAAEGIDEVLDLVVTSHNSVILSVERYTTERFLLIQFGSPTNYTFSNFTANIIPVYALDYNTSLTGMAMSSSVPYGSYNISRWNFDTPLQPIGQTVNTTEAGPPVYYAVDALNYFVMSMPDIRGPCSLFTPGQYNTLMQIPKSLKGISFICLRLGGEPYGFAMPIAADGRYLYSARSGSFTRYSYTNILQQPVAQPIDEPSDVYQAESASSYSV